MRQLAREDRLFYLALAPAAYAVAGAVALIAITVAYEAAPAFAEYGLGLLARNVWRPSEEGPGDYGLLAAIYGTLVTSAIAVALALPLSIALTVTTEEILRGRLRPLRDAIVFLNDVAAGLPTVVFGLWGLEVLVPLLRDYVMRPLHEALGFIPLFSCRPLSGASLLAAGVLLAFMVTPFMYALVREAYALVPSHYREAALSVSAAWHQYVRLMLGMVRPAVVAAALLGFGRAAGETVAVSLVVGNSFSVTACLFSPGYTIPSLIANQFGNAAFYPMMPEVLFAGSLVLLAIGLAVNWAGVAMLGRVRGFASR